ncbi:hypothetical protein BJ875DRAFT_471517 [Amylocarpus encephaloides]|uniref:2EXR domain-containing protein n=1 Tax=Amylocarpus encephaloides TaxID=45428 RepID=A0A9P7YBH1_9HELO|nr:hypothetical protein BJ875DRAFT_471517 [Amylocarpus encephaloides]
MTMEKELETAHPRVEVNVQNNGIRSCTRRPLLKSPTLSRAQKAVSTIFKATPPTFDLFSELPIELRMQIWEQSMEERVHELHPCAKLYNERMTFRSNSSQTPAIFHTCQESRAVALKKYQLMEYNPEVGYPGKGILRFYFSPKLDTLLLNSLMGLFMMFVLLEEEANFTGIMKGWETVAFDAERAQLITLLSGISGNAPRPRIREVFPSLQRLIIAFDYTKGGKTRFRTSVWPGENGTTLKAFPWPVMESREFETIFQPMKDHLNNDYDIGAVPEIQVAKVKRKTYIRGDIRYAFRKSCALVGIRPRGVFRRL